MTDDEMFAYAATQLGGMFTPSKYDSDVANQLVSTRDWFASNAVVKGSLGGEVKAFVGLVDCLDFNAWALKLCGRALVGINVGAVLTLESLFKRMLSDRRILPSLGDLGLEQEQAGPPLPVNYFAELSDPNRRPSPPCCPTRCWYADTLMKQALRFLLRHEMVHLCNGHIDFLQSVAGVKPFAEVGWAEVDGVSDLDRQVMEFDADCCAASFWAGTVLSDWYEESGTKVGTRLTEEVIASRAIPYLKPYFFNWTFAVCCLFRLFGDASFKGSDLTRSSYPPFRLRQAAACRTVIEHVKTRWDVGLASGLHPIMLQALEHAEFAFETLTAQPRTIIGLTEAFGDDGLNHISCLRHHWQAGLRAKILPYALDGYLPS